MAKKSITVQVAKKLLKGKGVYLTPEGKEALEKMVAADV